MRVPLSVEIFFLISVLTPVAAAIALVRSKRRSAREMAPSTMWVAAGLVVIRGVALLTVFGAVVVLMIPGDGSSIQISDGRVELESSWLDEMGGGLREGQRLTLSVPSPSGQLELCPTRMEPAIGRPGVLRSVEVQCWARRNLDDNYDGVDVGGWTMEKHIEEPPASVGRTVVLFKAISFLGVALVLLSLERILSRAARRQPFAAVNVRWLRTLAVGVAIIGILQPMMEHRFADELILEHLGQTGQRAVENDAWWAVGITPFLVVLLVLIVAEVWRYGIRLQEDAEATV